MKNILLVICFLVSNGLFAEPFEVSGRVSKLEIFGEKVSFTINKGTYSPDYISLSNYKKIATLMSKGEVTIVMEETKDGIQVIKVEEKGASNFYALCFAIIITIFFLLFTTNFFSFK